VLLDEWIPVFQNIVHSSSRFQLLGCLTLAVTRPVIQCNIPVDLNAHKQHLQEPHMSLLGCYGIAEWECRSVVSLK
jgi:hypothetical protein